ncbi:Stage II sporulation protein E (SpoIIE) [Bernardetia litoralis DSM 6794]|uniref:Stage II sporulation protein E (SpoIIE) n=1 Tax=Bernardetia litoralis (strain ATCC 23117 / DSM 6794 / NBRC 15988 / NCIMB 1366 / Fx l1 / Sio-4) TaxID=880071 RepID=I4AFS3_BERLS|nr:PP2C family protein-serine/threonine phosphatase [Bernardetia litoralis]AFM02808.1 Stage II sporulation protein E (SpoIIE) [Bernardetia litoralis DSM 6794]
MNFALPQRGYKTILLFLTMLSWVLLTAYGMIEQYLLVQGHQEIQQNLPVWLKGFLFNTFLLCAFFTIRRIDVQKDDNEDFYGFLWKAFGSSIVSVALSLMLNLFINVTSSYLLEHTMLYNFIYHIDFGLFVGFLLTAYHKWKHLITYQANKFMLTLVKTFEYTLFITLFFHFFGFKFFAPYSQIILLFLILMTFVLSVNIRWIAHLNFNQKIRSILLLLVILGVQFYFLFEFLRYDNMAQKSLEIQTITNLVVDLQYSVFFISIFIFTGTYSITSALLLLFNLPTSSVFEKKIGELASFQKLSESLLSGDNEKEVYKVLLESAIQTLHADAAWLEIWNSQRDFITKDISNIEAVKLKKVIYEKGLDRSKPRKYSAMQLFEKEYEEQTYQSVLSLPLIANKSYLGSLVLLKEVDNAFDNVVMTTLTSFVTQASLAIYNFRLITTAVETQRYQNELKIAHRVQESLLPTVIDVDNQFEIYVKAGSADEVGGDYYDYFQVAPHRFAVIIADVAGSGTSAAFYMAQMKGIFHSLVRLDLSPDLFMEYANNALSSCLEARLFITATYLIIDTEKRKIYSSRAGHCPTLYYNAREEKADFLEEKGIGLGIIRNGTYGKHTQISIFDYEEGDTFFLYTDGINEARHPVSKEEYGYDRIKNFVEENAHCNVAQIAELIIDDIYQFIEGDDLRDDYTVMVMRFD